MTLKGVAEKVRRENSMEYVECQSARRVVDQFEADPEFTEGPKAVADLRDLRDRIGAVIAHAWEEIDKDEYAPRFYAQPHRVEACSQCSAYSDMVGRLDEALNPPKEEGS